MPWLLAALPGLLAGIGGGTAAGVGAGATAAGAGAAAAGTAVATGASAAAAAATGAAVAGGTLLPAAASTTLLGSTVLGSIYGGGVLGGIHALADLGTVASSAATEKEGEYQHSAAKAQNKELTQQAQLDRDQAGVQIAQNDAQAISTLGRIKASAGASGTTTGGSNQTVYNTSTQEAQINALYTKQSGNISAMRDLYKAKLASSEGGQYAAEGLVGAGSGLLTGGIRAATSNSGNFGTPYLGIGP